MDRQEPPRRLAFAGRLLIVVGCLLAVWWTAMARHGGDEAAAIAVSGLGMGAAYALVGLGCIRGNRWAWGFAVALAVWPLIVDLTLFRAIERSHQPGDVSPLVFELLAGLVSLIWLLSPATLRWVVRPLRRTLPTPAI
jgi:hypothetical protein